MNPWLVGRVGLLVYGILLAAGGAFGYWKAKSRPSLIAGVTSGCVALVGLGLSLASTAGFYLGMALAAAMMVVFAARYRKTRKIMPSGMLLLMSLLMVGLLGWVSWSLSSRPPG